MFSFLIKCWIFIIPGRGTFLYLHPPAYSDFSLNVFSFSRFGGVVHILFFIIQRSHNAFRVLWTSWHSMGILSSSLLYLASFRVLWIPWQTCCVISSFSLHQLSLRTTPSLRVLLISWQTCCVISSPSVASLHTTPSFRVLFRIPWQTYCVTSSSSLHKAYLHTKLSLRFLSISWQSCCITSGRLDSDERSQVQDKPVSTSSAMFAVISSKFYKQRGKKVCKTWK